MTKSHRENFESTPESLEADRERLQYFQRQIKDCVAPIPGYEDMTSEALDNLEKKLEADEKFRPYIQEAIILLNTIRHGFNISKTVPYKPYDLRTRDHELSESQIEEQKELRKDMVAWVFALRSHIIENRDQPEYLEEFRGALSNLLPDEMHGIERGIDAEAGAYYLLKKYFASVEPGSPKEDGLYGVDFWVTTHSGKRFIIQVKSSSVMAPKRSNGIFSEQDVHDKISQTKDGTQIMDSLKGRLGAFHYTRAHIGVDCDDMYLMVLNADNVDRPTAEPRWQQISDLENKVKEIAEQ